MNANLLLWIAAILSQRGFEQASAYGILRLALQSWIYQGPNDCDPRDPKNPEEFKCDPLFTIKLLRIGKPGFIFQFNPVYYAENMNVIPFREVIGWNLSNPMVVHVRDNPGVVQLEVQAYDFEPQIKKVLIDRPINKPVKYLLVTRNNSGSVFTEQHGLKFSYSFVCSPDSVDQLCNNECRDSDDTEHGHYACDPKGQKHCLAGWIRPSSNCTHAHDCANKPCSQNGVCIPETDVTHRCQCQPGFSGPACGDYSEVCARANCLNGAGCRDDSGRPRCLCKPGFSGDKCQAGDKARCRSDLCQNGGTCTELLGGFACTCRQGFGGQHCESDLDECATRRPCLNGGTCVNTVGGFRCNCPIGLMGDLCQIDIDECREGAARCGQGQRCVNTRGGFDCVRSDGDECAGNPCKNGGVCRDMKYHFVCICPTEFGGPTCSS